MMTASFVGGVLSGIAGLFVFLVIHHLWIKPIWSILPAGLVIATLAGLAMGWSYGQIKGGLPPRPWTPLALFLLVAAMLAPGIVLAQLRPPPLDITTGAVLRGTVAGVIARFAAELLATATLVGGLAGWRLGHSQGAALATAAAGFLFALGPGHNIPFLGSTTAAGKGIVLLVAVVLVSALVLVETAAWFER